MKATFMVVLAIAIAAFLSMGCATTALWETKKEYTSYTETVDAFMTTKDDKKVIFLGRSFHYVFAQDPKFAYLLKNRDRDEITFRVNSGSYRVDQSNASAFFYVDVKPKKDDTELLKWLADNRIPANKQGVYSYGVSLKGERYEADKSVNDKVSKLGQSISIKVSELKPEGAASAVFKLAATPVAIAADGVILAGVVVVVVPLLLVSGMTSR